MSYIYTAFGIVWVVLIVYILNLIRLQIAFKNELDVLENVLEE
ncbi:MAG: CcmD family protein [Spirochaetes bacterium]|nr:CcmD family protein [Spirochaetota bacterium]